MGASERAGGRQGDVGTRELRVGEGGRSHLEAAAEAVATVTVRTERKRRREGGGAHLEAAAEAVERLDVPPLRVRVPAQPPPPRRELLRPAVRACVRVFACRSERARARALVRSCGVRVCGAQTLGATPLPKEPCSAAVGRGESKRGEVAGEKQRGRRCGLWG